MKNRERKIELIPPHHFEEGIREDCLADLYQSVDRLLIRPEGRIAPLPLVDWTLCEGVPGYVMIRLFAKWAPDGDLSFLLFQMVSRELLGGRHVEVFTSQHVVFTLPEYGSEKLLYNSVAIHVERQAELVQLAAILPSFGPDLELGALEPEFASLLQQNILPEKDADLSQVRRDSIRWLRRWAVSSRADLFRQFPPFAALLNRSFREVRSKAQLISIFKRLMLLHKSVLKEWNIRLEHRVLRLSSFPSKLQYPFGTKEVTSICVAVDIEKGWEVLDEGAVITALHALLPGIRMVEGSFLTYQPLEEGIRFLYFEVEYSKVIERGLIQKRLPEELKTRIGTLSHSLFLPRNEEEVLRSILVLSTEVRSTLAPPQVVVAFQGIEEEQLAFTVILVRLLKEGVPLAAEIIARLADGWKGNLEQDRTLGKVRQFEKVASVFTISVPNTEFLRRDRSVDLGAARIALTAHLRSLLPKLSDYHGGLMVKQEQILAEAKKLLNEHLPEHEYLLEELFYSLSPAIMQSYLQSRLVAYLFTKVIDLACSPFNSQKGCRLSCYELEGAYLLVIQAHSQTFQGLLRSAVDHLAFDLLQIASTSVTFKGSHFTSYIYLSEDQEERQKLEQTIRSALGEWLKKKKVVND